MGRCPGQAGTVPGTNGTRPWDKLAPVPGTNCPFSAEFHSKIAICPVCPLGRVGFVPGTIVPQGPSEMSLCVLCLLIFSPSNWPFFPPAEENHPKMPIWDPQNEFPGVPWIRLFLAFQNSVNGNTEFPGICQHFLGDGSWGPQIAFSGEDEVDMLGSGDL